jgi:haloalkane dehalogenase
MEIVRTPDERFEGLPGWSFDPHYSVIDAGDGSGDQLRVAHVDEGPRDASPVLCLHGEPSWSYLYRHMIPPLVAAGHRVVAPDLVGFGRSDKPVDQASYTYERHVDWMLQWLRQADLRDITLVCQDWGGLIGLRLLTAEPDRFARAVVANTFLPTGDRPPGDAFLNWQRFSQSVEVFDCGFIVASGCTTTLPDDVVAAYNAPFPDDRYCAAARRFPMLVPTSPDDPSAGPNRAAWQVLETWDAPLLTAFSDKDPVTAGGARAFVERVPGAAGQPHTVIEGGGHFLQEDRGPELAAVVADFIARTS